MIDYSGFAFPKPSAKVKATKTHRDGRVVLSKYAAKKKRDEVLLRIREGRLVICAICLKPIWKEEDLEMDHKVPRGMGGGKRDDSSANLRPSHCACNREKGSRRV